MVDGKNRRSPDSRALEKLEGKRAKIAAIDGRRIQFIGTGRPTAVLTTDTQRKSNYVRSPIWLKGLVEKQDPQTNEMSKKNNY